VAVIPEPNLQDLSSQKSKKKKHLVLTDANLLVINGLLSHGT